jgi:hypothetical protein
VTAHCRSLDKNIEVGNRKAFTHISPMSDLAETVYDVVPILSIEASQTLSRMLMFFFNLAWKVKVQLPTLLTVAFLSFDIRVRVEIEIQASISFMTLEDDQNSYFADSVPAITC